MFHCLRFAAFAVGLSCAPVWASDFVVVQAKINPIVYPKTADDVFAECVRDTACSALAKAAAAHVGVPPEAMTVAKAMVGGGKPSDSEEGRFAVSLPSGYAYCRSQIDMRSVVPADGKRASIFSATSVQSGLSIYTWTPKRGFGKGRRDVLHFDRRRWHEIEPLQPQNWPGRLLGAESLRSRTKTR